MVAPFLVWHEDDRESCVHDLVDSSKYLSRMDYNCLVNKPPDQHPTFEAGMWCMVKENIEQEEAAVAPEGENSAVDS